MKTYMLYRTRSAHMSASWLYSVNAEPLDILALVMAWKSHMH